MLNMIPPFQTSKRHLILYKHLFYPSTNQFSVCKINSYTKLINIYKFIYFFLYCCYCGWLLKINKIFVLCWNFCHPQMNCGIPNEKPSIWTLEMDWQKQSERWGLDPVWWDCSHLQPWWWLSASMWVWPHSAKQPCPEGWVTMSLLSTQTLLPLSSSFPLLLSSTGHYLLVHYSVTKPRTFFLSIFHWH